MLPIVAIVGRPNVGKSTLFNRFVGYRKAVVSPVPGTTRDRNVAEITGRKPYLLMDTGGLEEIAADALYEKVMDQSKIAIHEATLVIFMIDVKEGLTREDYHVADLIRKSGKKVILVASKSDSGAEDRSELLELGLGEPLRISAIHRTGVVDLEDAITKAIPKVSAHKKEKKGVGIRLAVIGRPNVGKSSLINAWLGSERLIVSEIAGTTIDATDIQFQHEEKAFTLVDTAGVRRRGKVKKGIEKYSLERTIQAAEKGDVSVLLIDGEEGITSQDQHVAELILEAKTGLILAVNKWDLLEKTEEEIDAFIHRLRYKFQFIPWAPVVFVSAKTGKNIFKILELAAEIKATRIQRIPTGKLNRFLSRVMLKHLPSGTGQRLPKIYYISQVGVNPPHFVLFVNDDKAFHFSYVRYLENELRAAFGFAGTAVKIEYRNKNEKKRK